MMQAQNPFFVGRQAELDHFVQLLTGGGPLDILNIVGHSGVGKSWLLSTLRDVCRAREIPFAHLDSHHLSDELGRPATLLTHLAHQLRLEIDAAHDDEIGFDLLLPHFLTALARSPHPVIVLLLDDYDRLFNLVDSWLRNLFRALRSFDHFVEPSPHRFTVSTTDLPRVIIVIASHEPVGKRWPPNPMYRLPLKSIRLADFSLSEVRDYLSRRRVPDEYQRQLFDLSQGHPLTLGLAVSLYEEGKIPPAAPRAAGQVMEQAWAWMLRSLDDAPDTRRGQIVELLRASALLRRFDQPLLAAMMNQPALPDALFDRVTALSMVVEQVQADWEQPRKPRTFVLHDALRKAVLEDARGRGLEEQLDEYRRRALTFYAEQVPEEGPTEAFVELALDILFLHSNQLIHYLFFGWPSVPLTHGPVSFDELDEVLEPLMRQTRWYQEAGFEGKSLERFIRETRDWLSLDRELHGEILHYFQVVRRSDSRIAGFVLNVPVTEDTLSLLRQDAVGVLYEMSVGPIEIKEQCFFALRLIADDWDSQSSLTRSIFAQMVGLEFTKLITVHIWPPTTAMLEALNFDALARGIEYEGYEYTVLQLDVEQYGGQVEWLLDLVGKDMGLIEVSEEPRRRENQTSSTAVKQTGRGYASDPAPDLPDQGGGGDHTQAVGRLAASQRIPARCVGGGAQFL